MLTSAPASRNRMTRDDAAIATIPRPIRAASGPATGALCFGPGAAEVRVHPRLGGPGSEGKRKILKPYAGMTIRLTPELMATLQTPGPKPVVELILKSVAEEGPVLVVGGVHHKTHSHRMAVGSEVHVVARTESAEEGLEAEEKCKQNEGQASSGRSQNHKTPTASMSIFASLHRKLIVQQVLTATKRAEIRARKHETDLKEKQAKNKLKRMDDHDEKLAAAGSMPAVLSQHALSAAAAGVGGDGAAGSHPKKDRKRGHSSSEAGKGGGEDGGGSGGSRERDPLTAWVYDFYRDDGYAGHVPDLRQFLKGIEFQHVMFRYHVLLDGTLKPDRRRFCVRFKTKAGRDLAVGRSGETFGATGSWSHERVAVVRGRNEHASLYDNGEGRVSNLLLVLPPGRSVAEVLKEVRARLPEDLTPALGTPDQAAATPGERNERANKDITCGPRSHRHDRATLSLSPRERHGLQIHRETLEVYRRDMLRAALGAAVAEAGVLGPQKGAPSARILGTDEDNARRVATLAANEAGRELNLDWKGEGARMGTLRQSASDGTRRTRLPAGPPGGARAQRREAIESTRY